MGLLNIWDSDSGAWVSDIANIVLRQFCCRFVKTVKTVKQN